MELIKSRGALLSNLGQVPGKSRRPMTSTKYDAIRCQMINLSLIDGKTLVRNALDASNDIARHDGWGTM